MQSGDGEASEESKDATVTPATIKVKVNMPGPSIAIRTYFSSHHLWAAHYSALKADARESQGVSEGWRRLDPPHRAYVTSAILSSVAFLEAAINEVFTDSADRSPGHLDSLPPEKVLLMESVWNATEGEGQRVATLRKYQVLLTILEKAPIPMDRNPYQDASLLIRLRNDLMHFKPRTQTSDELSKLAEALRPRFPASRLMGRAKNPYFPDHCLGAGCASWSVETAEAFADRAFSDAGIPLYYKFWLRDNPLPAL